MVAECPRNPPASLAAWRSATRGTMRADTFTPSGWECVATIFPGKSYERIVFIRGSSRFNRVVAVGFLGDGVNPTIKTFSGK
jgi:hypothetical protein